MRVGRQNWSFEGHDIGKWAKRKKDGLHQKKHDGRFLQAKTPAFRARSGSGGG